MTNNQKQNKEWWEEEFELIIQRTVKRAEQRKDEEWREKLKEIAKWEEPDPRAGEGGFGALFTSGLLTQYKYDKEKHEKQIQDLLNKKL